VGALGNIRVLEFAALGPVPAPRFARTPSAVRSPPPVSREHTRAVLLEHGFSAANIERLSKAGAIQLS